MKTYLAVLYSDSRQGATSTYKILKKSEIKNIKLYGEFVRLYELVSDVALSRQDGESLGLKYYSVPDKKTK